VDARIRELKKTQPVSELARLAEAAPGAEARHLPEALNRGDTAARNILDEVAGDLAFGLSHVVHLFHPQVIILGGGLSRVGEPLRAGVESALPHFFMEAFAPGPRVALTGLAEDAVPAGALILATQQRDKSSSQ
jgi:glucokinase